MIKIELAVALKIVQVAPPHVNFAKTRKKKEEYS